MALGEAIKQDFKVIRNNPTPTEVDLGFGVIDNECCFNLVALAQLEGSDYYKNDKKGFIYFFDNGFTGALMTLQKFTNGDWQNLVVLNNNDFGTYYAYGYVTNNKGEKLMGYLLDWQLVLIAHGQGKYRIKSTADTIFGEEVDEFSFEFCLYNYSEQWSERTARIDAYITGITGDTKDDRKTKDYGAQTWFDQIRLIDTEFGNNGADPEKKYIRYRNGKVVWTEDNQVVKFDMVTGRFPFYFHEYLRADIFQADDLVITVYDSLNPIPCIDKPIILDGEYKPKWVSGTMLAPVELKFTQGYENFRHKRC